MGCWECKSSPRNSSETHRLQQESEDEGNCPQPGIWSPGTQVYIRLEDTHWSLLESNGLLSLEIIHHAFWNHICFLCSLLCQRKGKFFLHNGTPREASGKGKEWTDRHSLPECLSSWSRSTENELWPEAQQTLPIPQQTPLFLSHS